VESHLTGVGIIPLCGEEVQTHVVLPLHWGSREDRAHSASDMNELGESFASLFSRGQKWRTLGKSRLTRYVSFLGLQSQVTTHWLAEFSRHSGGCDVAWQAPRKALGGSAPASSSHGPPLPSQGSSCVSPRALFCLSRAFSMDIGATLHQSGLTLIFTLLTLSQILPQIRSHSEVPKGHECRWTLFSL
jgi:hypothetical protein